MFPFLKSGTFLGAFEVNLALDFDTNLTRNDGCDNLIVVAGAPVDKGHESARDRCALERSDNDRTIRVEIRIVGRKFGRLNFFFEFSLLAESRKQHFLRTFLQKFVTA